MIPAEFRQSGLKSYTEGGATWADAAKRLPRGRVRPRPDAPHARVRHAPASTARSSRTCSPSEYEIQLNKTSRNSVLLQTNINNTRSDVANLLKVLVEISKGIDDASEERRRAGARRRSRRG